MNLNLDDATVLQNNRALLGQNAVDLNQIGSELSFSVSPLITEPLPSHSTSVMLAAVRTAIENGADVNAPDTEPRLGWKEGRPLDACLRSTHMPGKKDIRDNLPVIELLVEHGADPRLYSRSAGLSPLGLALYYSTRETTEDGREWWKHLVNLFEEAISRLEGKGKEATVAEQETLGDE